MSESGNDSVKGMEEISEEEGNFGRLVPVGESIRYRRRAQGAEQRSVVLEEELCGSQAENKQLRQRIAELELETRLVGRLASSGASDIEAAVLLAKARLAGKEHADVDEIVRSLKAEKEYLFAGGESGTAPGATLGARSRKSEGGGVLERAARRAAGSGDRRDLHEYLRLRRGR